MYSLTLKPNVQKIILRTSTTQHVERLRCVSGILPADVRLAFEQKTAVPVSCMELPKAPIDSEPPLLRPVRPNFWIPIANIFSYVIPFFLVWVAFVCTCYFPEIQELIQNSPLWGAKIRLHNPILAVCFLASFAVVPMIVGGLWCAFLMARIRMNAKQKLLAWFVPILAFCFIDWYILASLLKFPTP